MIGFTDNVITKDYALALQLCNLILNNIYHYQLLLLIHLELRVQQNYEKTLTVPT